jgi:hypothetical protein
MEKGSNKNKYNKTTKESENRVRKKEKGEERRGEAESVEKELKVSVGVKICIWRRTARISS